MALRPPTQRIDVSAKKVVTAEGEKEDAFDSSSFTVSVTVNPSPDDPPDHQEYVTELWGKRCKFAGKQFLPT